MKKHLIIVILLFIVILNSNVWSSEEGGLYRIAKYQSECKNPTTAVLGAWIFPSVGHAYAGNWTRGLPFLVVNLSLPFLMSSAGSNSSTLSITYFITRIWEYVDAYSTAEETNKKLAFDIGKSTGNLLVEEEKQVIDKKDIQPKGSLEAVSIRPVSLESLMDKIGSLESKYDRYFNAINEKIDKK